MGPIHPVWANRPGWGAVAVIFLAEMLIRVHHQCMLFPSLEVYATVPFNRNGAVASILRIAYKAWGDHLAGLEQSFGFLF